MPVTTTQGHIVYGAEAKTKSRTKARAKPSLKAGQRLRLGANKVGVRMGMVVEFGEPEEQQHPLVKWLSAARR